jgi:hypothetical protein
MHLFKLPNDMIHQMMAWGQYLHWSSIQREQFLRILEEDTDIQNSRFIGSCSHWMASLYVAIEGWYNLKQDDKGINQLLSKYEDYILILKRCRNAVYHYQTSILDKRIQNAFRQNELSTWADALQSEFERYLFIYPIKNFGISPESMDLQKDYFGCIGWKPKNNVWVKWFELFFICYNYVKNNQLNKLEKSKLNDLKIAKLYASLNEINPNNLISLLSRIDSDT